MQFTTTLITMTAAFIGLSAAAPAPAAALEERFVPGQCGVHVTQFQKNQNGVGADYKFEVIIKDAVGAIIGGDSGLVIPDFGSAPVSNEVGGLPNQLVLTVGSVDADPVQFSYNGATFSSSNGCSTGGYENGDREMDCGFAC